jgi:hypothetical protein
MTYTWTQVPIAPLMSGLDGIATVNHNDKVYALGGWIPPGAGTTYNRVLFTTNGTTWTQSTQTPTWEGRHVFPAVSHLGKILVLGGDSNRYKYQPDVHSWTGNESDPWVVETTNAPWGNRIGHVAFSYGGYVWVGFGQTHDWAAPIPSMYFTDLWRSPTGLGNTWEKFEDKMVCSYRGFICNTLPILDNEVFIIAGGTYNTPDFPTREYFNDVYAMKPDFSLRLVNSGKGSVLKPLMYHNTVVFDAKLWVIGGANAADLNTVYMSEDKGVTWTQMPTPPWSARHAAICFVLNNELFFGTGAYDFDMWKLSKVVTPPSPQGVYYGAPVSGVTSLSNLRTVIDQNIILPANKIVDKIGMHRMSAGNMTLKICKQTAANTFQIVYSQSVSHSGGGYQDFDIPNFTVPNDGFNYRIGFALTFPTPDSYGFVGQGRWMKVGDLTGTHSLSYFSDGSFCLRWQEA